MLDVFHELRRLSPAARIRVLEALLRALRTTSPFSCDTNAWLDGAIECAREEIEQGVTR